MKKLFSVLVVAMFLFSLSFVFAAHGSAGVISQYNENAPGQMISAQQGQYKTLDGKDVKLERVQNKLRITSGNMSADCEETCNLTQERIGEETKFYSRLSNGMNAEIKIMPNVASEVALERLRLNNCNENCTLELKEVGVGNATRMAYELKSERSAKVLGLFKTKMNVEAQIDAETGEVLNVKRPWWSFVSSEIDDTEVVEEAEEIEDLE